MLIQKGWLACNLADRYIFLVIIPSLFKQFVHPKVVVYIYTTDCL